MLNSFLPLWEMPRECPLGNALWAMPFGHKNNLESHAFQVQHTRARTPSLIQTLLSVPEFNRIGPGKPGFADYTAGGEFHPAPKTSFS